ncbi:hypothetical protein SAMN05421503_0820 [Terribacillus aidingensis]|uniref:DUF4375 domain-containing protein n=1 Tax=Terribacillus aidingensis TaxID=586416 RepID=A0A285NB94_9BACI|nr:hypothetical protein [Terribacillus aidingensis]SNZ04951.1 hypothetical protein SAMN05421503_0820 [Terribacillus aidingensis]
MDQFMTIISIIVAIALVGIAIFYNTGARKRPMQNADRHKEQLKLEWDTLKVRPTSLVDEEHYKRLEDALDRSYLEKINNAFRQENYDWSQNKINTQFRGLFRFFLLASIFRSKELFDKDVHRLWEVMRQFEEEYKDFCRRFFDGEITEDASERGERHAEERERFEIKYLMLFQLGERTPQIWGEFFQYGDGKDFVEFISTHDLDCVKQEYMAENITPDAERTFENLYHHISWGMEAAADELRAHKKDTEGEGEDMDEDINILYFLYIRGEATDEELKELSRFTGKGSGYYATNESFGKLQKK